MHFSAQQAKHRVLKCPGHTSPLPSAGWTHPSISQSLLGNSPPSGSFSDPLPCGLLLGPKLGVPKQLPKCRMCSSAFPNCPAGIGPQQVIACSSPSLSLLSGHRHTPGLTTPGRDKGNKDPKPTHEYSRPRCRHTSPLWVPKSSGGEPIAHVTWQAVCIIQALKGSPSLPESKFPALELIESSCIWTVSYTYN